MSRRKRVKNKWHFYIGDFHLKKATFHSNGKKTFEVWYQNDLLGFCFVEITWRNSDTKLKIFKTLENMDAPFYTYSNAITLGHVYYEGSYKQFPKKILKIELYPEQLNIVAERKLLLEKWSLKLKPTIFVSPGVYTIERDISVVARR